MTILGLTVTVAFCGLLVMLLAVFMQLPAGLDRVESLGHQRSRSSPGKN
jgi:hypothetical protein